MLTAVGCSISSSLTWGTTSPQASYRLRDFFTKVTGAPLRCVSFSAKGHARLPCSVASALATVRCRYQPFAGSDPPLKAEMHSLLLPLYTSERVTLVPIFYCIKNQSPAPLFLLFRKKSRSAHLFACKRVHDGALSLPTFCELQGFNSHHRKR